MHDATFLSRILKAGEIPASPGSEAALHVRKMVERRSLSEERPGLPDPAKTRKGRDATPARSENSGFLICGHKGEPELRQSPTNQAAGSIPAVRTKEKMTIEKEAIRWMQ